MTVIALAHIPLDRESYKTEEPWNNKRRSLAVGCCILFVMRGKAKNSHRKNSKLTKNLILVIALNTILRHDDDV